MICDLCTMNVNLNKGLEEKTKIKLETKDKTPFGCSPMLSSEGKKPTVLWYLKAGNKLGDPVKESGAMLTRQK